jgi:ABC-type microcin C transport system duplicated ATPase subunit YejF
MKNSSRTGFSLSQFSSSTRTETDRLKPVLLEARNLRKTFPAPASAVAMGSWRPNVGAPSGVTAVDDVSMELAAGETLAIVGESGSGKTTLARMLLRLIEPDSGELRFEGRDFLAARGAELRALRREMQMVFQDPFASLDPRMRVGAIVGEPLEIHEPQLGRAERRARVVEILRAAGLGEDALARYPHEFSGGQRQRIGIARALVLRPRLVVADEPVSALDVSVGAQILELLQNLQRDFALTYLLISHSLPVVAQLATRIAVMQDGRIVETGPAAQILSAPAHPYTQSLIAAIPALPAPI